MTTTESTAGSIGRCPMDMAGLVSRPDFDAAFRREADPQVVRLGDVNGRRSWAVYDPELVRELLGDERLSNDSERNSPHKRASLGNGILLQEDGEAHTAHRRALNVFFGAKAVNAMKPRIQTLADTLLDRLGDAGETDLITAFALPLPLEVICELLGIPDGDRDTFRHWANAVVAPAGPDDAPRALAELGQYMTELVTAKAANPGSDLLSELLTSQEEYKLTPAEVADVGGLVLLAGHETTTNLVANTVLSLLENPDQLALVRAEPQRIPDLVEEGLRHSGPVTMGAQRVALTDLRIGSTEVEEGEMVHLLFRPANHTEGIREDADTFDVTRSVRTHLAFGGGEHYCLGQRLARAEAVIAFTALLSRFSTIELAVPHESLTWRHAANVRSLHTLPIRYAR